MNRSHDIKRAPSEELLRQEFNDYTYQGDESPLNHRRWKKIRAVINRIVVAVALAFILWFLIRHQKELVHVTLESDPVFLALSLVSLILFLLFQSFLGIRILRAIGCKTPYSVTLPTYLISLLGKYIPGKVWVLTMRIAKLSKHSVPATSILAASVIEHIFVITTGLLIYSVSVSTQINNVVGPMVMVASLVVFFFFIFCPRSMHKTSNALMKLFKKPRVPQWPTRRENILFTTAYILTWLILGISIFLLTRTMNPSLPWSAFFPLTASYALAVVAGFLAFFAPGGIGVREGIFVLTLKNYVPLVEAVYVSIAIRIVFSLAELVTIGLVILTVRIFDKSKKQSAS